MSSDRLRILVVDDSALYRQMICNVLRDITSVEVVGVAKDGLEAVAKIAELSPDAITLDYEMPGLNGIQVLRRIRRRGDQLSAIMVSSYTEEGAKVTTDALLEGAFDFIRKPTTRDPEQTRTELRLALMEKLATIIDQGKSIRLPTTESTMTDVSDLGSCDAIVIGASTGGPVALRKILSKLPGYLPIPIIVVQHMPMQFTAQLARRLNEVCELDVVETSEAARVRPGAVYIAAGGHHTKLVRRSKYVLTTLTDDPRENSCRPAVDYTLRYAAKVYEGRVCAIILTGMGHDGSKGCETIKKAGGSVFACHPSDCTVYGMPKTVIDNNLADRVLRLTEIAPAIISLKQS